jgi:hypothetical protein
MVAADFDQTLRALKAKKPFRPFTIEQVGGERFEIDFPDVLAVRDGVAAFVGPGGVPVLFDHESVSRIFAE